MGGIRGVKGDGKGRGGDAGIVLDERWCGKGYAVESLEASLSWCFTEEGENGDEVRAAFSSPTSLLLLPPRPN